MVTVTTRAGKGERLTHNEVDANFTALAEAVNAVISVVDYGAVGDGVTNDTAALRAAHAAAKTAGLPLYIPAGRYRYVWASGNYLMPGDGLTVFGDGMFKSVIVWDTPQSDPGSNQFLFGSPTADTVACSNVEYRDFGIEGNWTTGANYNSYTYYPMLPRSVTNLNIDRVRVNKSPIMSIAARNCAEVRVTNCRVDESARDGISVADCKDVIVASNSICICGDDAIAFHGADVGRGITIANNSVLMAIGGISGHSCQRASIVGNTIMLTTQKGIDVDTNGTSDATGAKTGLSIVVTGNTISNVCNRTAVDNAAQGGACIIIGGKSATAGTLPVFPGRNNSATGVVYSPFPYSEATTATVANGLPMMGSMGVVIANNTCSWDLTTGGELLSTYGYGEFQSGAVGFAGSYDPTVNENLRTQYGIDITAGLLDGAIITGNTFMGLKRGMGLSSDADCRNVKVTDNIFMAMSTGGFAVIGSTAGVHDIEFRGNTFDLDPFYADAGRDTDGSWTAADANEAVVYENATGFKFVNNTFRNCSRISSASLVDDASYDTEGFWLQNIVECDPTTTGFNVNNKGVGHVPRGGEAFIHRIIECDPNQAGYSKVKNNCLPSANAMPAAGTYVLGHFVRNSNPSVAGAASSQYAILGWLRLTTGTGHVLDTDWIQVRGLTGT